MHQTGYSGTCLCGDALKYFIWSKVLMLFGVKLVSCKEWEETQNWTHHCSWLSTKHLQHSIATASVYAEL